MALLFFGFPSYVFLFFITRVMTLLFLFGFSLIWDIPQSANLTQRQSAKCARLADWGMYQIIEKQTKNKNITLVMKKQKHIAGKPNKQQQNHWRCYIVCGFPAMRLFGFSSQG